MNVMKWMLDSDPAIRWQVMRDLTDEAWPVVAAERARVANAGWGARLLESQSPRGHWGPGEDRNGLITVHSLTLLKDLGADPEARPVRRAIERVRKHVRWHYCEGRPYFDGETEACINGRVLATGGYFGAPSKRLLEQLLGEQLADGGWNCEAPKSTRSSFHSTICVLEGLLEYEKACGRSPRLTKARTRAQDYLLARRLCRSLTTGAVIDKSWMRFQFPPSYHYDVLRGLDYFRRAGWKPDERMAEAIGVVRARRHQNGVWPLNRIDPRRFTFDMEAGVGMRSHWNTLRALRVLKWHSRARRSLALTPEHHSSPSLSRQLLCKCVRQSPAARAIRINPAATATAPVARATRWLAAERRSSVMAAVTAAIARMSMTPMTSRIAVCPAQQ